MQRQLLFALATSVSVLASATSALAQDTTQTGSETIVVTGSRASERSITDSPVPVDVIGGDQLQSSGYTETNKVLNQIVPSFNFPQPSLTDGTDSLRPATLRGLAPDQTLVLVNGKRRHPSALLNLNGSVGRGSSAVDLNEIPPIAIERIEVLRDGASSLYGSDAIAGVINLQLRRDPGVRATVTWGKYVTTMDGVPDVTGVATSGGLPVVATNNGGANDLLEVTTTGKDRTVHDGETLTLATNLGVPVGEGAYLNVTAQFRDRSPTNRSGADRRRQYPTIGDPRELTFDRYNHRYGDGETQDFNFLLNTGAEIGGGFEIYAFGSYGLRDGNGAGFYRRANDSRNRDWAASASTFVPYYPDGFLPLIVSKIEDVSVASGIKGELGGFDVDLSAVYGSNTLDYSVENSFNVSLGGVASPTKFDAGGLSAGQGVVNLDFSRQLPVTFAKSLGVAFGGEYRRETYKIRAGETASWINGPYSFSPYSGAGGAQVFPGFRPNNATDVSRSSVAGYVELDSDLNDLFSVQLAGRFEHFTDFGDTVNGKIAVKFEPVKGLALRGSASTGFRAPSLAQQYFATTSTNNVAGTLIEVGTFPVSDPVSVALGSKPLKAEKSTNLGGGVIFSMIPRVTITADYYNIKIRDRIVLTENLTGSSVVALLTAAGITNASSARFFVNGVDTRTQGVDVVASYSLPETPIGTFKLSAGYNYNDTKITDRATLPSLPGLTLFGRAESFRLTDGQPQTKLNLGVDWSLGPVAATFRGNRYGEVFVPGSSTSLTVAKGDGPGDFTLTPKWVFDAEVRVTVVDGVELAVGADNLFDEYPDTTPVGGAFGTNGYFLPYSSFSPFGFNGRFLYSRLALDF
ncbi:MAG: TonB-dependent receptor plug domain-containing protein [Pseudomonadota bacterium]